MREVIIPGIDVRIPTLGFGCSSLVSSGAKNARRLLDTAFDAGVRHFDVARYYGYGEAEGALGDFAAAHRAEITITTKFGIEPPRRTGTLRLALRMGRNVLRLVPAARKFAQRQTQALVRGGVFSADDARKSLETSLRELKTDYIDFYLLHDYAFGDHPPHALIVFLEDAVRAGKVRYFGLGTSIGTMVEAMQRNPQLCSVVQFENSVVKRNVNKLAAQQGRETIRLVITHGALGESYRVLSHFLESNRDVARDWSARLGADCSKPETISSLMLNYALAANGKGVVLFSSKSPARVLQNIRSVTDAPVSAKQIDLFT